MAERGILRWGSYLPRRRLDRSDIAAVAGGGGGKGTRTVAAHDEDTTTMAVEAARRALHPTTHGLSPASIWFATVEPAYLDKSNAATVHAALRLDRHAPAYDVVGSVRSTLGALRSAVHDEGPALVAAAGLRTGLPGGEDESAGGDAAAAVLVGEGDVVATIEGWSSTTDELLDRWRRPGDAYSSKWEDRFAVPVYVDLAVDAWTAGGFDGATIDHLIVTSPHERAAREAARKLGVPTDRLVDDLGSSVGHTGAAHPLLLLAAALDVAEPGQRIALVSLSDGADVVVLRATDAIAAARSASPVTEQVASGAPVPYGKFLAWRGMLPVEPPRRPEPARPSSSAAHRNHDWKYGFVGSENAAGDIHLPPLPIDEQARPMADAQGTIVTFTVDRLSYSPSPPTVFAVVDFDGGGRLPVELTDADAAEVAIGGRVEMTFRRLFTAEGIHNYFWKARLVR
jgi:3-hydroxy-3-methylglutaryl CoA synthase/uncharacterized OB-fold protein